jgi:hypothetical protein
MDYGFEHNGKVYTPNGTPGIAPVDNADRNQAIETAEPAIWQDRPLRMAAYYRFPHVESGGLYRRHFNPPTTGAVVTTWRGAVIGHIIAARVYWHNFGGRFVALTVRGTNGATYYGRASWDNGTVVRLHRSKV